MKKLPAIFGFAVAMTKSFEYGQKEWKDKILNEWENSKNYPRKKKKQVRKRLLIDWSLACWSPFDDI